MSLRRYNVTARPYRASVVRDFGFGQCVGLDTPAPAHWGSPEGYRAHAYGEYEPGGNPVLAGPLRATPAEAEADLDAPTWDVVGYLCG